MLSPLPPCNVICNITIYADDTTLYYKDQASDPWQQLELASELNLIYKILWTGVRSDFLISMLVKLSWFRLAGIIRYNNNGSIDVKMDGSVLQEK